MSHLIRLNWTQSLMTASATVAMIAGAVTVYYLIFPPPEPPPLCFEYRLRQTELISSVGRYEIERRSLSQLTENLSVEHEAIERVIIRYSDLRRWESLIVLSATLQDGLQRRYDDIQNEFGPADPNFVRDTPFAERRAWENLLADAGWPPSGWPRAILKYWLDDYTDLRLESRVFFFGPVNRAEVQQWLSFLEDIEKSAYLEFDLLISDSQRIPDVLGPVLETNQRTSLYETGIVQDVLERLRDRRIFIESRQYEVDRDSFAVDNEILNIEAEQLRIRSLSDIAKCTEVSDL